MQPTILTRTTIQPDKELVISSLFDDVTQVAESETHEITSEKSIGIDSARKIKTLSETRPLNGKYKVVIVWEAERLTLQAQNALLKLLEEPAEYFCLVLVTSNQCKLLGTVRSRCKKISLKRVKKEEQPTEDIKELIKLTNCSVGEKITAADQLPKDRQLLLEWFATCIGQLRFYLKKQPTRKNLYNLTLFLYGHKLIKENVHTKLVLDTILIRSQPMN